MEECCHEPTQPPAASCPWCGKRGQAVRRVTVESLTHPDDSRVLDLMQCFFCNAPSCDVVYFSVVEKEVITKNRLRVRVGIKETVDPIPLCYCFTFDRKAIWQDIWSRGATDIPKIITERIKAGECRCEVTNPSGRCCLGDVYHAIKQAKALDNHPAA